MIWLPRYTDRMSIGTGHPYALFLCLIVLIFF